MQTTLVSDDKENVQRSRNQILAFSPQKLPVKKTCKNKASWESDTSDAVPVLLCAPFQSALWIGMGCVPLNTTVTKIFELRNETKKNANIVVEQWETTGPAKAGFSVSFGVSKSQSISIPPEESVIGYVTWTPVHNQSVSESAILRLNDKLSLQITLHGIAGTGDVSDF
jgi:Abnormal spindle-like microcephaly-assoc'd, ASPM-SPD-2-Hydin